MVSQSDTILSLRNVSKNFGGINAVSDVSLDITYGERRLFIGTNGAGKTTLFNLIAGDIQVSKGEIHLFGKNVTDYPVQKRVKLGMRRTYQTSALFDGLTVRDNLFMALLGDEKVLNHLNIFKKIANDKSKDELAYQTACDVHLENKFNTPVKDLSHGERRQLELGLAIITKPKLLLFDEPASGLSVNERKTMQRLIQSLDRNITIVLIEHDMDMAFAIADYITVMYDGRLLIEGSPEEIKSNNMVREIYLGGSVHGRADS